MKTRQMIAATLICLLSTSAARAASILELYDYHGDEVKAKANQPWLGLYTSPIDKSELKETKVSITMVNDQIIDEDPKVKTGKRISVPGKQKPQFLISGVAGLKAGSVITSPLNKKEHLEVGQQLKLTVGSNESTLIVAGKKNKEYRNDYSVTLKSGGTTQVLVKANQIGEDSAPSLKWCGDLDGDGKLDLIMDITTNYNESVVTLFLSSKAKPGKLVNQVAQQIATGC